MILSSNLLCPFIFLCYNNTDHEKSTGGKGVVVIFDPQDVLTDTAGCRFIAWQRMAWEQGILYDEDLDARLKGVDTQGHLEEILRRARREYSSAERLALLTRQEDLYEECVRQMGENALLPGASRMLRHLRRLDIPLAAVMTAGTAGQVLTYLSVRPLFACIARQERMDDQLREVMERMVVRPADCLLVTACGPTANLAWDLGMRAFLCDHTEGEKNLLRRILSAQTN